MHIDELGGIQDVLQAESYRWTEEVMEVLACWLELDLKKQTKCNVESSPKG